MKPGNKIASNYKIYTDVILKLDFRVRQRSLETRF